MAREVRFGVSHPSAVAAAEDVGEEEWHKEGGRESWG